MKYAGAKTGSNEFAFVDELQLLFADALSGTLFCFHFDSCNRGYCRLSFAALHFDVCVRFSSDA